jgi:ketosteroid isomerase-like protein
MDESANVAVIRRLVESFNEGDLEYPFSVYESDIRWENFSPPPAGMDEVYEGHEGVRRFWREWLSSWEWVEFEQKQYFAAGDRVVVFQRTHARGRTSGVETDFGDYAQVWTLRDGRVTHVKFYVDRDEALADAGVTDGPS